MDHGRADGACDGGKHGEPWSLHENFLRASGGVYTLAAEFGRGSKSYGDLEQGVQRGSGVRAGVWRVARGQWDCRRQKKDRGSGRGFRRPDESGIARMRAGGLPRREDHLFERIWAGESRRERADHTAERVRHGLDVETIFGREHPAAGKTGKAFGQRRRPKIHSRASGLRAENHDPAFAEPHQRTARLPDADGAGWNQYGQRDDRRRCVANDLPAEGAEFCAGKRLALQQHRIFPAVGDREAGKRENAAGIRGREYFCTAGDDSHSVSRRPYHTSLIANRAMAYDAKEKGGGYSLNVSYFEQTGDGAVHTSVEDLLKWDENFYSGQIGGKAFLAEIQEQGKLNSGKVLDYAKGLRIADYRGLRTVSHGGSWGGYRAELLRFPEQHFSVVCLCNLGSARPSNRAQRVADIYLAGVMQPRPDRALTEEKEQFIDIVDLRSDSLSSFVGDFWSDELRATYRFAMVKGNRSLKLSVIGADGTVRSTGISADALIAGSNDVFRTSSQ